MFKVTLGNKAGNYADLFFSPLRTSIAKKWVNEIVKNYPLYEIDRFTNWPDSNKKDKYYEVNLLKHISIINKYDPIIINGVPPNITQEYFNFLHKHFEDLRGHIDYATTWYNSAPSEVKYSIDRLNILIHEYENYLEEQRQSYKNPTIVGTFKDRPTHVLEDGDYKHFTHQWKFGTVYINYCEVGKPLLDVFKDRDEYVGKDAVRPQSTWSADFMIKFGVDVPRDYAIMKEQLFWEWFDKQPLDIRPERAALGMIPVAQLTSAVDIDYISKFDRIESVCIV